MARRPLPSRARAAMVCDPLATVVEFQLIAVGGRGVLGTERASVEQELHAGDSARVRRCRSQRHAGTGDGRPAFGRRHRHRRRRRVPRRSRHRDGFGCVGDVPRSVEGFHRIGVGRVRRDGVVGEARAAGFADLARSAEHPVAGHALVVGARRPRERYLSRGDRSGREFGRSRRRLAVHHRRQDLDRGHVPAVGRRRRVVQGDARPGGGGSARSAAAPTSCRRPRPGTRRPSSGWRPTVRAAALSQSLPTPQTHAPGAGGGQRDRREHRWQRTAAAVDSDRRPDRPR